MKRSGLVLGCMLSASGIAPLAHAVDGVSLEIGQSSESTMTYKLGAQFDFGQTIWQNQSGNIRLGGFWDAGVTRWSGLDATSFAVTPTFVLEFGSGNRRMIPYIEAGIGAAYFTRSEFESEDRDLGSRLNFEDRIGAGVRFSTGSELGVRLYHYSNAGLASPNQGIETVTLHYRFDI
ncbi:MAG TPA: acyloxyacyl hydrolase [Pseudomonas xinjiangensis]|uniref:Lipid A deacylase n=2 Tax=root TaxID=1 RepID=A0A7V1FRH5_9GAMM|nr:acyloxyacyl hydrolase [Halopseudomonas xinjiangensis]HEC49240.1 acyloxyacyl hydrolase [Halopseudomonas xinjiangensis]